MKNDPNKFQSVPPEVIEEANQMRKLIFEMRALARTVQSLSNIIGINIAKTNETLEEIRAYIGEQLGYRLYRDGMEQNTINFDLEQSRLDMRALQVKVKELQGTQDVDEMERRKLEIELEGKNLLIRKLEGQLQIIERAKGTTEERIKAIKPASADLSATQAPPVPGINLQAVKQTIANTAAAIGTGGVIAFVIWLIRLYMASTP